MTTKKRTQGDSKGKAATLDARAEAVVNNVTGYDGDTRLALSWALARLKEARAGASVTEREREVQELLDKAERREYVFDVDAIGAGYVYAAQTVYDILDGTIETPEFVRENLQMIIQEAGRRTRAELWVTPNGGDRDRGDFSVQRIARMFRHHETEDFRMVPERDLAELVAAVLTHPDVPQIICDKLTDALTEMHDSTGVYDDPRAVAALLDYHTRQHAEEGGE